MKRALIPVVLTIALLASPVAAAGSAWWPSGTSGEFADRDDPAGVLPNGDLTVVGVEYVGEKITLAATVSQPLDPAGSEWRAGEIGLSWGLDVPGGGTPDFQVDYYNDGFRIVAELFGLGGPVACDVGAVFDGTRYIVHLPASCIGSPGTLGIAGAMVFEDGTNASIDFWPASGYAAVNRVAARSGYWMVTADGEVHGFGNATAFPRPAKLNGTTQKAVDVEPTPSHDGYRIVTNDGRIEAYGDALAYGLFDPGLLGPGESVTSLSATPAGTGYWMFTSAGRVFPFGDARSFGDLSGMTLNAPVLDSIGTPSGRGYYMVAADGGIFAFGDARFRGSMGATKLNAPVQSLVPDPDGRGYWLAAADGGVFAFDAPFRGSMAATRLNQPITGMVPNGNGYLMVAEDGGIFNFSDTPFLGSLGSNPPGFPVTAVAPLDES